MEELILEVRKDLVASVLGERGALAIHRELIRRGIAPEISAATIGRVLKRRGGIESRERTRRRSPPKGWHLPEVARGEQELDCFDTIEALSMGAARRFDVLTAISLHGGLPGAWPMWPSVLASEILPAIQEHWRRFGLPGYVQFDNDRRFQGALGLRPRAIGRVPRLCMSLGVIVVFAPIREHGPQSSMESFNALWRAKVWERLHYEEPSDLIRRSDLYVEALRERRRARIEDAPARRAFPKSWALDLQAAPRGKVFFLRRASERGVVQLLGRTVDAGREWSHRLLRCEADFSRAELRVFGLRRSTPGDQPLLRVCHFTPIGPGFDE